MGRIDGEVRQIWPQFLYGSIMFLVALGALWLLIYVGFAEGRRTYQGLIVDKMAAQGELVQSPLNTYLRSGLPLRQFPGFRQIARRVLSSDTSITAITAVGRSGHPIFRETSPKTVKTPTAIPLPDTTKRFALSQSGSTLRVILPLRDRFEIVGAIVIRTSQESIVIKVTDRFVPIAFVAVLLAILFAIGASLMRRRLEALRIPWLHIGFGALFLMISAAVVFNLISLYADGVQSKAQALADSLRQRLEPVTHYQLRFSDLDGLRATFLEYRKLNPDIQTISLMQAGRVRIHTNKGLEGTKWKSDPKLYEFASDIGNSTLRVMVAVPTSVVWQAVAKNIKNFIALFIATALFAAIFLRLGRSVETGATDKAAPAQPIADTGANSALGTRAIEMLKPVFFLAVFFEHLPTSFLPQLLRSSAQADGLSQSTASWAFSAYFLCFLLTLIPATKFGDRRGPKPLLWGGALLAGSGAAIFMLSEWFPALAAARGLSGIGQGMILIGAQSYILNHAPANMRARAAAVIVFGFNGGMIAGTAIGSLLVSYLDYAGVFGLALSTSLFIALFSIFLMPSVAGGTASSPALSLVKMTSQALRNLEFLSVILFVGLPSKAVLTGIVIFAVPLVLSGLGYPPEDIGQLVMIYPCGVLLANGWITRRIDLFGGARKTLVIGTVLAGAGLVIVGIIEHPALPDTLRSATVQPILIGLGLLLLGLAHGFVNAPVISHIATTEIAQKLGANQVSSLYRVIERVGHVAGPALASQLLVLTGGGAIAFGWAGVIIMLMGVAFWVTGHGYKRATQT